MESQLAGKQKMVLTAKPAAQAERLIKAAGPRGQGATLGAPLRNPAASLAVGPAGHRPQRIRGRCPLLCVASSPLYRGRVLHLKGRFTTRRAQPPLPTRPPFQGRLERPIRGHVQPTSSSPGNPCYRKCRRAQQATASQRAKINPAARSETIRDACAWASRMPAIGWG